MKHLLTTALLCGAGILGGQAQNVVITDKDGIAHRFHADYVQEITFEKIQAGDGYDLKFDGLEMDLWGKRNITLHFTKGDETRVSLDIYQPEALWLQPGTYNVDPSYGDYTIDPGYSTIVVDENMMSLSSGDMIVSLNGETYTFDMDFTLASGETLKGSYTGELPKFGPTIKYDLTNCAYVDVNDPADNGFYYRFNDSAWLIEMRIDLFSEGNAPAPGVYTFSDTMENGTASSYVNLYSPYNETTEFTEGTVTVSGEGANTEIVVEGTLGFGMPMKAVYKGQLPARPNSGTVTEYDMTFESAKVDSFGDRNETITLYTGENQVVLDFYQPAALYFQPGKYTVNGSNDDFTIDPSYSKVIIDGKESEISGGEVSVELSGDVYTFTGEVSYDGKSLTFIYNGTLPVYGPVVIYTLEGCTYVDINNPAANGFYYRFNDSDYKLEMRIDLFSEGDAPAPGTYTFSDTMENGTALSNIDLFVPYVGTTKFTEGTVTISGEGDATIVDVEGTITEGLTLKAKYVGALPARPVVKKEYDMIFESAFVQSYGNKNETITLYTDENQVVLDFWQPENKFFQPGTYIVNDSNDDYTIDPTYSKVALDGVEKKITAGTVTVALEEKVYTFEGEVEFEGGSLKFSFTGELPKFGPKDGPDVLEFDLTDVYYVSVNDPAANGFYYRFNDAYWSLEMRIDIFSSGESPAAGTYTFTDTMEDGTASSNIDLYNPYMGNVKFTEGTVTISGEGDATVVEVEGTVSEDLIIKAKYVGALPARSAAK